MGGGDTLDGKMPNCRIKFGISTFVHEKQKHNIPVSVIYKCFCIITITHICQS